MCGLCSALITLDFREPAGRRAAPTVPMLLARPPAQTQVSRHATAAVTMLVNGLTRQGTANDGTLSTVRDALSPSCRLFSAFQVACNDRRGDNYRCSALSNRWRVGLLALYDIV